MKARFLIVMHAVVALLYFSAIAQADTCGPIISDPQYKTYQGYIVSVSVSTAAQDPEGCTVLIKPGVTCAQVTLSVTGNRAQRICGTFSRALAAGEVLIGANPNEPANTMQRMVDVRVDNNNVVMSVIWPIRF